MRTYEQSPDELSPEWHKELASISEDGVQYRVTFRRISTKSRNPYLVTTKFAVLERGNKPAYIAIVQGKERIGKLRLPASSIHSIEAIGLWAAIENGKSLFKSDDVSIQKPIDPIKKLGEVSKSLDW